SGGAVDDPAIPGPVEQRRHPELEIHTRGDKQVRIAEHSDEAGLGLHEMWILVALRDRGDGALVAYDLPGDGAVSRKAGDNFRRGRVERGRGAAGPRGSRVRRLPEK